MQRHDTTYHGNGKIASLATYEGEVVGGMTQAEAFQRGLRYRAEPDTLYTLTEATYFDERGNRIVRPDRPLPDRRVGRGQRHNFRKYFGSTTGSAPLAPIRRRYAGRVGSLLTDTLVITNWSRSPDSIRLHCTDPVIRLDTTLILAGLESGKAVLRIRPKPGDRHVEIQSVATLGEVYTATATVEGYDLAKEDFAPTPDASPVFTAGAGGRREVILKIGGPEKLLRRRGADGTWLSIPIGRGLDRISLTDWNPGDYPLELVDLRSGKKQYLTLRVW